MAVAGAMKIVHVSYTARVGGAAVAMHRLHTALLGESIRSEIVAVFTNGLKGPNVHEAFGAVGMLGARVSARLGALASRFRADADSHGCSVNILPNSLVKKINRLSPDIVHLHWLGANTLPIQGLRRIRAPIVWTLHDMWAFCGAEHCSFTERWKTGYPPRSHAPRGAGLDVDAYVYRAKQRCWRGLPLDTVSPSTWMHECATSAAMWRGRTDVHHHVIANGLPLEIFKPQDRLECRRRIGIPDNATVILFGAHYCDDSIKGADLLTAAIPSLRLPGRHLIGVTFGASGGSSLAPIGSLPTIHLGTVGDPGELAKVYGCADVMVVPSRMESFCQTASEAQACGIPVACFDATGLRDVVEHKVTGYRARPFDPAALAAGIEWCVADRERHAALGKAARARAEALFCDRIMARRYTDLYRDILRRQ
jgi:glycosyltransferase involved in cell wall biosynthesis